jgi:DNA-binding protein
MMQTAQEGRDNCIFVGDKPFMNYVAAIIMQFTTHEQPQVQIKARGKHISRAIDVSEVTQKDHLNKEIRIENITSSSDMVRNREGKEVRVSTVEIILERTQ